MSLKSDVGKLKVGTPTISIDSPDSELENEDAKNAVGSEDSKSIKNGTVNIDVTKALLLLGFTSWSAVEEGTSFFCFKTNYLVFI